MRPEEYGSSFVSPKGSLALFVLYLLAVRFSASLLAAVLFAAAIFVTAAWVWGRNALKALETKLEGSSLYVFPGEEIRFSVRIGNRKHLPLFWLTVLLPEPERRLFPAEPGRFNWILPFQEILWEQCWKAERRGLYSLGCLELLSGDGFGLAADRKLVRPENPLFIAVWPELKEVRTEALPFFAADLEPGTDGYLEDLTLLKGTRSCQPGDSMKRINWRVLAQQGKMEVNLFEELRPKNVTLLADLPSFGEFRSYEDREGTTHYQVTKYYEKELEEMFSLAASLISALSAKHCRLSLILPAALPAEPLETETPDESQSLKSSKAAAAFSALPAFKENSGLFRPEPEDAVPELLTRLAAVKYRGGPAVWPQEEVLRSSSSLGQIFVFVRSPETLSCRQLLDRLPEQAVCLVAGEADSGHPVYRVIERREILG